MRSPCLTRCCGAAIMGAMLFALGCSSESNHFKVTGKVVDGDKAVLPDPNSSIHITFTPDPKTDRSYLYSGMLKSDDGTFEILGDSLKGMPAGKYRVNLRSMSPNPSPLTKLLSARFSDDKTPLQVTVVDEKTPLVIDIAPFKK